MEHRRTASATSKFKGVHWHKGSRKWAAAIRFNNQTTHLGYFTDEAAAARAYDEAARRLHGDFAALNFTLLPPAEPIKQSRTHECRINRMSE